MITRLKHAHTSTPCLTLTYHPILASYRPSYAWEAATGRDEAGIFVGKMKRQYELSTTLEAVAERRVRKWVAMVKFTT